MFCSHMLFLICIGISMVECRPPIRHGAPVSPELAAPKKEETEQEFERYIQEVSNILQSDRLFMAKLNISTAEEIKAGDIAKYLEFAHPDTRTKLDEAKRMEKRRLDYLIDLKAAKGEERKINLPTHMNPKSFRMDEFTFDDLDHMIKDARSKMDDIDVQRREKFKQEEMKEKYEIQHRLNSIKNETVRKFEEELLKKKRTLERTHEEIDRPLSPEQIREESEVPAEEFKPETYFRLHDLDDDKYLDEDEIRTAVVREVNKVYSHAPNSTQEDIRHTERLRSEELERMKEDALRVYDTDKDGRISFSEFMAGFNQQDKHTRGSSPDESWKGINDMPEYSDYTPEEYRAIADQMLANSNNGIYPAEVHQGYAQPLPASGYQPHVQGYPAYQQPQRGYQQHAQEPQNMQGYPSGYQQPGEGVHPAQVHPSASQGVQNPEAGYQQHNPSYQQIQEHPSAGQAGYQQPAQGYMQQPDVYPSGGIQKYPAPQNGQPPVYQNPDNGYPNHPQALPPSSAQGHQAPVQDIPHQNNVQMNNMPQNAPHAQGLPDVKNVDSRKAAAPPSVPRRNPNRP